MSRGDYERPAWYQVGRLYRCKRCGNEQDVMAGYSAIMPCPSCGGFVELRGETYPGNADEWDEERNSIQGEWRRKR